MKLENKIFQQTSYNIIQQVQKFFFGTLTGIIVVNALPREEYGVIGLATGYFVFVLWFAVSPEAILAQRYQEIKNKNFIEYISTLFSFSLIRAIFLFLISFFISLYFFIFLESSVAAIAMLMNAFIQITVLTSGMLQYILKIELKQKKITKWTTVMKLLELAILSFLFFIPNIFFYFILAGLVAVIDLIIWVYILRSYYAFKFWVSFEKMFKEIKENIISFSLWNHLSNNLIQYIYQADIVFLGMWSSLTVVGNYAISLKIANFSFILPSIIQSSAILTLSRLKGMDKRNRAINILLRYSGVISIFQFLAFLILGKFYVSFYTRDATEEVYLYTVLILFGVSVLNVFRPLIGYIISQTNVRNFFVFSVLPSAIFTTTVYYFSARYYGAVGLATANIICYSFWVLTILLYIKIYSKFKFNWIWIDEKEVQLIKKIFKSRF